jgi:signal recognition particle subunit SRP54
MGPVDASLNFPANRPATIMMVGLQGSGKTTTTGKLVQWLIKNERRKPMLVAADIYRPAAVEQLRVLGRKVGVPVWHRENASPVEICREATQQAFLQNCDTILFDTAGRLTIDETLMRELSEIKAATPVDNILLVVDAMMGQDAVTTARAFDERLNVSGVIMTKLDGDARGGAALSVKEVTGKPIKFLGMGEGLDALEPFRPEGLADRILGMGDVVGLMRDFEKVQDRDRTEDMERMFKGQFTFRDFYDQISMIQKMGSLKDIVGKLPMQDMLPKGLKLDDGELVKIKAMIDSMTAKERMRPEVLDMSRMMRVAKGSGRSQREVEDLVKRFKMMRGVMGMLGGGLGGGLGGMLGKIPGVGALSQMNNARKAMQAMRSGGGLPGMGAMPGMPGMPNLGGMGGLGDLGGFGGGDTQTRKPVDRDKLKKLRKAAKDARKKNRGR